MAVVIYLAVDQFKSCYSAMSFLVGAFTSIGSGYIAMKIATKSNFRTTYMAYKNMEETNDSRIAMAAAFRTAYSSGVAMGFVLVSIALAVLVILILVYFYIKCEGDATGDM